MTDEEMREKSLREKKSKNWNIPKEMDGEKVD